MSETSHTKPDAVPDAVPDALDCDLGWALGVVFRAYIRTADALVSELPGGARGYQVLAAAAQELSGGQGALAQRLGIDKTVMTYLVDDLERAGLVERRPDPADRRNKRVLATAEGRATWASLRSRLEHAEEHVLAPLEAAERPLFRELLRKLAVRAHTLDPVESACELVAELDRTPSRPRHSARH
ncbi:MarR family winged helix-turn-helix transcriptional regulator [Nonomuraea sp. NPDC048916]|uniref:MarR family winged helix-turn-helix transcriptional regulator n=1 Tax=Nonomuraea sp. NPDC048916 TaxID=3154232 RepID=UPI0033E570BA